MSPTEATGENLRLRTTKLRNTWMGRDRVMTVWTVWLRTVDASRTRRVHGAHSHDPPYPGDLADDTAMSVPAAQADHPDDWDECDMTGPVEEPASAAGLPVARTWVTRWWAGTAQ